MFLPDSFLAGYLDNAQYMMFEADSIMKAIEVIILAHPEVETILVDKDGTPHKHLVFFVNNTHVTHSQIKDWTLNHGDSLSIEAPMAGG